jgi:YVTN family beta-propeller protein
MTAVVAAVTLLLAVPASAETTPDADREARALFDRSLEREGIEVNVRIEPAGDATELVEGDFARVRIEIMDGNTDTPMPALYPAAWMDRMPADQEDEDRACQNKVEGFVGGSLLSQAEVDMNVYYVLALNEEASISVVDPLFGFGGSKLLSMVPLPAPGSDWALTDDQQRLFVSMPETDRVAVIETIGWKLVTTVEVGPGARRLALQPDGAFLWVAHDEGISVVSPSSLKEIARIAAGDDPVDLAFSDDNRWVFVANSGSGTVSVIDAAAQEKVADLATGSRPVSLSWSPTARTLYVADAVDGTIAAIDPESAAVVAKAKAAPGLTQVKVTPDGLYALAVSPTANRLFVLDAASNRVIQDGEMEGGPDQIAYSDELAYVRHRDSETMLTIPLPALGAEGQPIQVIDFPGGTNPPGNDLPIGAAGMEQAPGAPAMLIANAADGAIHYYKEGMAAPMGTFSNYGRTPLAVKVVDRSLQEIEPGVYQTGIRLRRPGHYELAFFLDTPRIVHCFPLDVAANPKLAEQRRQKVAVRPLSRPHTLTLGESVDLRFEVTDTADGSGLAGIEGFQVLTVLAPGRWHDRNEATDEGDGVYSLTFTPQQTGVYYVYAGYGDGDSAFNRNPFQTYRVVAATAETDEAGSGDAAGGPLAD